MAQPQQYSGGPPKMSCLNIRIQLPTTQTATSHCRFQETATRIAVSLIIHELLKF